MKFASDLFVSAAANVAISLHLVDLSATSGVSMQAPRNKDQALKQTAKDAVKRNVAKIWFIAVLANIALSALLIALCWYLGVVQIGIGLATFLWAVLFGWLFTFYISAKIVSAVFGALLGSGTHNIVTGTGFATGTERVAEGLARLLKLLPPGALGANQQEFISWMVWLFFGLITPFCLPALFKE
jgi:hypothetical protein